MRMSNHWDYVFCFLIGVIAYLVIAWVLDECLLYFETKQDSGTTEEHLYEFSGEEISDPYVRIEAQDAEIQRLYGIIEGLKEDIYLLRNIRHSEPQNAGSQSGVASTEGLADSTALEATGDCA